MSNIAISLALNDTIISPGDSQLREPIIAQWLLHLTDHALFTQGGNHELCFFATQPPQVVYNTAKKNLYESLEALKHLW